MKLFISWSGDKSKKVASCISSWLRQLIQSVDPWISTEIEKGSRWNDELSKSLEEIKVGIICLTQDNLNSKWVMYEAGALSKAKDAIVGTFLLDISPTNIEPPLSQFQSTKFEKEDVRQLVHTINKRVEEIGEKTISDRDLDEIFEILYPKLENELTEIISSDTEIVIRDRKEKDLLEDLLNTTRVIQQKNVLLEMKQDKILYLLYGITNSNALVDSNGKNSSIDLNLQHKISELAAKGRGRVEIIQILENEGFYEDEIIKVLDNNQT